MRKYKRKLLLLLGILGMIFISGYLGEKISVKAAAVNKTYTVTLNPQGGTVGNKSLTVTFGSPYGSLPTPIRTNYVFRGWYTFSSAGTLINANKKVEITGDHTLYAQWSGKDFDITLDYNGAGDSKLVSVRYGTKYLRQLPVPVRSDYVFTGWYTKKTGGEKITAVSVYKDKPPTKLYAQWKLKVLTITFVSFNGESYELEVTCTKTFGNLPVPKKEGYTFKGWYTWEDYTDSSASPIISTTLVNERTPLLLFARWY